MNPEYILGLDAGGTRTSIQAIDLNGKPLKHTDCGALNINGQHMSRSLETMEDIRDFIMHMPQSTAGCCGICIGAAGAGNTDTRSKLEKLFQRFYNGPLHVTGDHDIALYGAFDGKPGIILIAGTGSICYGKNKYNIIRRTGGCGHLIDDEGSGYAIGRDILSAVVQSMDGRKAKTVFVPWVLEAANAQNIDELISYVYNPNTSKKELASFSTLLNCGLACGDHAAKSILEKAVYGLTQLVIPLIKQLRIEQGPIAFLGGVLNNNKSIAEKLECKLLQEFPEVVRSAPAMDAAFGAAKMMLSKLKEDKNCV